MKDAPTLYELTVEYQTALESLEVNEDGEVIGIEALDDLEGKVYDKTESVAIFIKGLKAQAEAIAAEEKALKARRDSKTKLAERLSDYLWNMMQMNGMNTFETAKVRCSSRKSEAVIITNEDLLPADYMVETITRKPDKTALKKAIKSGEVIEGAEIEVRENLQIK